MMVILEGPRGVGKTKMANELCEFFNCINIPSLIAKFERGTDPIKDMQKQVVMMKDDKKCLFIVDRFHLTEFVMSSYHKRVANLSGFTDKIIQMDSELHELAIPMFILDAPDNVIQERIEKRNDGRGQEMPILVSRRLWNIADSISDATRLWVGNDGEFRSAFKKIRSAVVDQIEINE